MNYRAVDAQSAVRQELLSASCNSCLCNSNCLNGAWQRVKTQNAMFPLCCPSLLKSIVSHYVLQNKLKEFQFQNKAPQFLLDFHFKVLIILFRCHDCIFLCLQRASLSSSLCITPHNARQKIVWKYKDHTQTRFFPSPPRFIYFSKFSGVHLTQNEHACESVTKSIYLE